MAEHVTTDRDGPVARIELNRPDVHNAFDDRLIGELREAFEAVGADDAVRAVVLGGRGKSFCAGADLNGMRAAAQQGREENLASAKRMAALFDTIDRCPKPVIGRIHGPAIGGGTGLVACCDVPVATERARFAFKEVRLGIAPAVIAPFVVRRIGEPAARELFVTGSTFGAERARAIGLVHRVEADEEALDAAIDETVAAIRRSGPRATAACKELARSVAGMGREEAVDHTADLIARLRASPEGQEGMTAFLEGREPSWHPNAGEGGEHG